MLKMLITGRVWIYIDEPKYNFLYEERDDRRYDRYGRGGLK